MTKRFFVFLCLFVVFNLSKTLNSPKRIDPCFDFYDYACSDDTRSIRNFPNIVKEEPTVIPFPKELQNLKKPINTTVKFKNLLIRNRLTQWLAETESLILGLQINCYPNYKLVESDVFKITNVNQSLLRLHRMNTTCVDIFYNALNANIQILKQIKPATSKRNPFLHWIFEYLKNATMDEINESQIVESEKLKLINDVQDVHSFFAFYDFNNVTFYELAKHTYELEYHKMRMLLQETDLEKTDTDKILRLCAIEGSIKILREYVDLHDKRFIFQAVVANPSNDAFQYLNTNHVTVLTRTDPKQPKKALADTMFVTAHEIIHKLYPFGASSITKYYDEAMKCTAKSVQLIGDSDDIKPLNSHWFNRSVVYEDVVNIIALRIIMKQAAKHSSNDNQLKSTLKTLIGGLCKQGVRKNQAIPFHNPLEISLNNAVRQYPYFAQLYQCKRKDRMFADKKELCRPLGKEVFAKDYKPKKNEPTKNENMGFFEDLLTTSKAMNFSFIFS